MGIAAPLTMMTMLPRYELGTVVTYDITSTAILLLLSLSVAFVRPSSRDDKHDSAVDEVTPILVPRIEPRRALVFSLLSLVALTYFADGAVNVIRAVIAGAWANTGLVGLVSYVLGLAAFGLLAIFLSLKDVQGAGVGGRVGGAWGKTRVRVFVALAIVFHIVHGILAITTGNFQRKSIIMACPVNHSC